MNTGKGVNKSDTLYPFVRGHDSGDPFPLLEPSRAQGKRIEADDEVPVWDSIRFIQVSCTECRELLKVGYAK